MNSSNLLLSRILIPISLLNIHIDVGQNVWHFIAYHVIVSLNSLLRCQTIVTVITSEKLCYYFSSNELSISSKSRTIDFNAVIRNDSLSCDTTTLSMSMCLSIHQNSVLNSICTHYSVVSVGWMGIFGIHLRLILQSKLQDLQMDPVEWLDRMLIP